MNAQAHYYLGRVLREKSDPEGAVKHSALCVSGGGILKSSKHPAEAQQWISLPNPNANNQTAVEYTTFNTPAFHFGKVWAVPAEATTGILALSINEGAYMREIIRAGIDSIDKGQMEAAKSLGMRYGLAMRRIILPQAARVIVPPLGNEFNNMMKNTSLIFVIGVYELFADASAGYSVSLKSEYFFVVAFWYLMLTTAWTFVQAWIERRLARSERGEELSFRERLQAAWNPTGAWLGFGRSR